MTTYVYNIEDRLSQGWSGEAGTGTLVASYYYDPFGSRLWKDVSGTKTFFHYSDEGLIAEYDAGGSEIKTYGWKPGSTWTTDPLFMKQGGKYYFYHNDHLGTPHKMAAVNGAVVWSAKFTSFLEATVDSSSIVTNNLRAPSAFSTSRTHNGFMLNWANGWAILGLKWNRQRPKRWSLGDLPSRMPSEKGKGPRRLISWASPTTAGQNGTAKGFG